MIELNKIVNEYNIVKSTDNYEYNLDKLKPGTKNNILYITGYPGAGKSTLMANLYKEYNNIIPIAGDDFYYMIIKKKKNYLSDPKRREKIGPFITEYLDANLSSMDDTYSGWDDERLSKYFFELLQWLEDKSQLPEYKDYIFVVDGTQIYHSKIEYFKDKPVIIIGTAAFTAYLRKANRDVFSKGSLNWKHFKTLFTMIPIYNSSSKLLDDFKNVVDEGAATNRSRNHNDPFNTTTDKMDYSDDLDNEDYVYTDEITIASLESCVTKDFLDENNEEYKNSDLFDAEVNTDMIVLAIKTKIDEDPCKCTNDIVETDLYYISTKKDLISIKKEDTYINLSTAIDSFVMKPNIKYPLIGYIYFCDEDCKIKKIDRIIYDNQFNYQIIGLEDDFEPETAIEESNSTVAYIVSNKNNIKQEEAEQTWKTEKDAITNFLNGKDKFPLTAYLYKAVEGNNEIYNTVSCSKVIFNSKEDYYIEKKKSLQEATAEERENEIKILLKALQNEGIKAEVTARDKNWGSKKWIAGECRSVCIYVGQKDYDKGFKIIKDIVRSQKDFCAHKDNYYTVFVRDKTFKPIKAIKESADKSTLSKDFQKKSGGNFKYIDLHSTEAKKYLAEIKSKYVKEYARDGELVIDVDKDTYAGYIITQEDSKDIKIYDQDIIKAGEYLHDYIRDNNIQLCKRDLEWDDGGMDFAESLNTTTKEYLDQTIELFNKCLRLYTPYKGVVVTKCSKSSKSCILHVGPNYKEGYYTESAVVKEYKESKLYPVFIVTVFTGSTIGKIIQKATHNIYSHAALALDSNLEKLYSYNLHTNNTTGGLSFESISGYIDDSRDATMQVSVVYLKKRDYKTLKDRFKWLEDNYDKTSYNVLNLFKILIGKVDNGKDQLSMVCSQFVDSMFKFINVDLTDKPSSLVTPGDISKINHKKVYKIYEGSVANYDPELVDKQLALLNNKHGIKPIKESSITYSFDIKPIFESKEFPIQFDEEGNLLISKKENIDFLMEYKKTKKLRVNYAKYNNLEGMKYEAAKLWYMNTILIALIENWDGKSYSDKEDWTGTRSKILTEFSLYMNQIQKIDTSFNFSQYYESTPFGSVKIKINRSTIVGVSKIIKQIMM